MAFLTCVAFTTATVTTAAAMFCDRGVYTVWISLFRASYGRNSISVKFGFLVQARAPGHASKPELHREPSKVAIPPRGGLGPFAAGSWAVRPGGGTALMAGPLVELV